MAENKYRDVHGDSDGIVIDGGILPKRKIPFMRGEDICYFIQALYNRGYVHDNTKPLLIDSNRFSNEPHEIGPSRAALDLVCRNIIEASSKFWLKLDAEIPTNPVAFIRKDGTSSVKKLLEKELSMRLTHDEETDLDLPINSHHDFILHTIPFADDIKKMFEYISIMRRPVFGHGDHQVKTWYLGNDDAFNDVLIKGKRTVSLPGEPDEVSETFSSHIYYHDAGLGSLGPTQSTKEEAEEFVQYYLGAYRPIGYNPPIINNYNGLGIADAAFACFFIFYNRAFQDEHGDPHPTNGSGQWYVLIPAPSIATLTLKNMMQKIRNVFGSLGIDETIPSEGYTGSFSVQVTLEDWAASYSINDVYQYN